MVISHEIIFTPILAVLIGSIVFTILKKMKRSSKSIYKLIDDLEKNTYINFFLGKKINQILYLLLLLNLSPNQEDEVQPNDLCYQYQLHSHNS